MIQISRVKHISNLRYYMLVYIIVKYIFNIFLRNISNNKQFKNVYYKMQSTYLCDTVHVFFKLALLSSAFVSRYHFLY